MLKVNLGKRKKGAAGAGLPALDLKSLNITDLINRIRDRLPGGGGGGGEGFRIDWKTSPIPKIAVALGILVAASMYIEDEQKKALDKLNGEIAAVERETEENQRKFASMKDYEEKKRVLEEDEKILRAKLETLNSLLENRNAPVKMMLQVAQGIPEEVWLTEMRVGTEEVSLAGGTPGYNQVSDFLKALTDSTEFADVSLRGVQEDQSGAKERFQTFEIQAKRRRPF